MQKKCLLCFLCIAAALPSAFAQEFNFSGEMKTGIYWESRQVGDEDSKQTMQLGNSDGDSGGFNPRRGDFNIPGRFRLNLEFKPISTIGFKVRFEDSTFTGQKVTWAYSYAYGNFLDDQLKISAGKLGDSPWETGGPEINSSIDQSFGNSNAGIRTEYKPAFVPGLDVGFVLNPWDYMVPDNGKGDIEAFLGETVLGVAYTNDIVHARFAWRLDGPDRDNMQGIDGHDMVYRVEEKLLRNYVPGLSVSANGLWTGLVDASADYINYRNWLYITFAEYNINAQLRIGYEAANLQGDDFYKKLLILKPMVFYSFTPMLSAGLTFVFEKDFGELSTVDYDNITIEPQFKVTFNPNAYVALVYGYQRLPRITSVETANYVNLRLVYSF